MNFNKKFEPYVKVFIALRYDLQCLDDLQCLNINKVYFLRRLSSQGRILVLLSQVE